MLNTSKTGWFIIQRDVIMKICDPTAKMCDLGATIWLISQAAFQDYNTQYKGKMFEIKRGQLPYSVRKLAEKFNWSKGKVERFLDNLEKAGIIKTHKSTVLSILTICNYKQMQSGLSKNIKQVGTHSNTQLDTQEGTSIKNQKNKESRPSNNSSIFESEELLDWQLKIKQHVSETRFNQWVSQLSYDGEYVYCEANQITYCNSHLQIPFQKALGNNFRGFRIKNSTA